ncbi:DUF892 family protein [Formosa agariphila]|uniref:DUF892 family protein n=1 Tax=Formosa agariphila TaxID=320324 RepID=UPI001F5A0645|nr:DUF892 family protein [Formosa agariphila]
MSAFGTALRYAKALGFDAIAEKLQRTDESYNAENKLDKLADSRLNEKAIR